MTRDDSSGRDPKDLAGNEQAPAPPRTVEEKSTGHVPVGNPGRAVNLPAWTAEDVDRYQVVSEHARGALGRILEVTDRRLDRRVALKELLRRGGEARFIREAFITARLQHPSIVPVHDLGRWTDGKPYYVMKMVSGRSLAELIAERSTLDERLALLPNVIAVAEAMAYAHSQRIIHRDLKPSNILVGPFGETMVVDWGLAADLRETNRTSTNLTTTYQIAAASLMVDGAVMGTAPYMPSEQAEGKEVEERADVYAIGAVLYHLLAGTPPYEGNSSREVLQKVASVPPEPLEQKQPAVPQELATIVHKAMARDAEDRYRTAGELAEDLKRFQTGQLVSAHRYSPWTLLRRWVSRHRAVVLSVVGLLFAVPATYFGVQLRVRRNLNAQVQSLLTEGAGTLGKARDKSKVVEGLRNQAFSLFDNRQVERGEEIWEKAALLARDTDALYSRADRSLEAAILLKSENAVARTLLAGVLFERALLAERDYQSEKRDEILARLPLYDDGTLKANWETPAKLHLDSKPSGAQVTVQQYRPRESQNPTLETWGAPLRTPAEQLLLPAGSYLLTLKAEGTTTVRMPVLLKRGEDRRLFLALPRESSIPKGYAYVPPGPFLFGTSESSSIRKDYLGTVPLHEATTGAYLIAVHETTYGDWLDYLNSLSFAERLKRAAAVAGSKKGILSLKPVGRDWELAMQLGSHDHVMRLGDTFYIPERSTRQDQNWRLLPVGGVSTVEIEGYLSWLEGSTDLIRPRLCTELEWERAARGADEREYPQGKFLSPEDANYDQTYGNKGATVGPDEVGAHPNSRSPFGIDDMCGNESEFTRSALENGGYVLRGGGFHRPNNEVRNSYRLVVPSTFKSVAAGFRVCGDLR